MYPQPLRPYPEPAKEPCPEPYAVSQNLLWNLSLNVPKPLQSFEPLRNLPGTHPPCSLILAEIMLHTLCIVYIAPVGPMYAFAYASTCGVDALCKMYGKNWNHKTQLLATMKLMSQWQGLRRVAGKVCCFGKLATLPRTSSRQTSKHCISAGWINIEKELPRCALKGQL